jgi:hypothetical protein
MNAEKSRYTLNGTKRRNQSDYVNFLEDTFNAASLETLRSLLLDMVVQDKKLLYQLTARLMPMCTENAVALLNDAIELIKGENALLNGNGQADVARIADAFMEKSKEHLANGQLLDAASACFAILLAIEPQLTAVTDEGDILQTIMKETFGYLHVLADNGQDPGVFATLSASTTLLLDTIPVEDRCYEAEWLRLAQRFGERG